MQKMQCHNKIKSLVYILQWRLNRKEVRSHRLCQWSKLRGQICQPGLHHILCTRSLEIQFFGYDNCLLHLKLLRSSFFSVAFLFQVITEMTGGGADYCFECVGSASLVQEAYACCRKVSLISKHKNKHLYLLKENYNSTHKLIICWTSGLGKNSCVRRGQAGVTGDAPLEPNPSLREMPFGILIWRTQT